MSQHSIIPLLHPPGLALIIPKPVGNAEAKVPEFDLYHLKCLEFQVGFEFDGQRYGNFVKSVVGAKHGINSDNRARDTIFFPVITGCIAPPPDRFVAINEPHMPSSSEIHHPMDGVGFNQGMVGFEESVQLYPAVSETKGAFDGGAVIFDDFS